MIRKSMLLASAGLFVLSAPAFAQEAVTQPTVPDTTQSNATPTEGSTAANAAVDDSTAEQQPVDTGNIIITATRRNQALSDVPMAVSAITADTLQNSGATDIRALTQLSPSLLVSSTSSEAGAATARIRGIGTVGDNPGLEGSVSTYIDGVYRSRTGVALTELGPIDRIEILRGPQGTLFGRNASAGVISVITAKPQFRTFVSGAASYGNYDYRRLDGSINVPLGQTVAARLDGTYVKRDGFLKDVISGRRVNDRDRFLLRGQILFQPNDNLTMRLIADYSQQDEECCAAVYLPASNYSAAGRTASTIAGLERALGGIINDDPYRRRVSITPGRSYRSDVKDGGLSAEVNYDFGGAQLTSITAYRGNKYIRGQDADFNNLDILYRDDDGSAFNRFSTFSQELRLQGEAFNGRLDWLVGGFFANEKLRVDDNLAYGNDYGRYSNCLVAANFASSPGLPASILNPSDSTCFNPAVAAAVLPFVGPNATALAAFARLGIFAGPGFGNSGFANLATLFGIPGLSLNGEAIDDSYNQRSRNFAVFTHNIFKVTNSVSLTVGLRYTKEQKRLNADLNDSNTLCTFFAGGLLAALQQLPCVSPSIPGGSLSLNDKRSEGRLSGTGVLSWKPTDALLTYASYSRGYKAGGFNLDRSTLRRSRATTVAGPATGPANGAICVNVAQFGCSGIVASGADLQFKPETNDAFELGAKYNGRGFDVNVAVFQQEFKNFQLNTFNGLNFFVVNINSCSKSLGGADTDNDILPVACNGKKEAGVRSRGVEVETFFRPMRNINGALGVSLVDTRYRHDLIGSDGNAVVPALFQLPGRRISNAPYFTLTGSLGYTPAIGSSGMHALFYVDGRHTSSFNTGSDLDIEKTQKSYTVFNGRVGLRGPSESWAVELWAQNLFNTKYKQVAFDAPLQGSGTQRAVDAGFVPPVSTQLFGAFLGEPRTFGATLRYKWAPRERVAAMAPMPVLPPPPPPPAVEMAPPPPPPPPPAPVERGERGE